MKYSRLIGCTVALVSFAHAAAAKTSDEVQRIARSTAVEIKLQQNSNVGSGVIIHQQGDLYTLVTNLHVVCGRGRCSTLPEGELYTLGLTDGQKYQVKANNIKILGGDLDLAIIQFRSSRKYAVAQIAPESLKSDDIVYTAGFPLERSGFSFNKGEALMSLNKRLTSDKGGYSTIYNADTLPGMSGGGVFNSNGQLVAIHGLGDRFSSSFTTTAPKEAKDWVGEIIGNTKTGFNRGIPVGYLVKGIQKLGINLGQHQTLLETSTTRKASPATAEEHFITGFNKLFDPSNGTTDIKQSIQEFSTAIKLNPQYANAYFMRAMAYSNLHNYTDRTNQEKGGDIQLGIKDCDRAIAINPNFAGAYALRGSLRAMLNDYNALQTGQVNLLDNFIDDISDYKKAIAINPKLVTAHMSLSGAYSRNKNFQAALDSCNQAIMINQTYHLLYMLRAGLKSSLNDYNGALSDMNQAISLQPNSSMYYFSRGMTKGMYLKDRTGAIQDLRQAEIILQELNPNSSTIQLVKYMIQQLEANKPLFQ
jgi:tetratricopeptide (TPR) repeat protein